MYIIPSNKNLTSTDGVLQLTPRDRKILNLSIDVFFTSLADVHKEFAVGVVLSGTGSDGTLGLKAIKENGGISIVQDFESAAYDSMPQSAVNAGVVDFILAPEKIPAQLLDINRAYQTAHFFKEEEEELPKDDEAIFKQILLLLHQSSGVDFTNYKQPTFHRRIARRIAIAKKINLTDYLKFLRTDKDELDALFLDVLIPVTSFFRDPKTFQTLCDTVFPAIFKNKFADDPIRVWIAGCSTGEEAFSIAIGLHEFLGEKSSNTRIQIFASDISEKSIKKARAAIYTKDEVEKISATKLKNYFVKNNGGYEVSKLIRDMCVFAPHNFLKDPPFAKMDLISCRNVLIYMDTFLQKKAFSTFHYALKDNGFLLLGNSETTGASSDLFTQFDKHEKIYSRKPAPGRFMHVATERKEEALATKDKTESKAVVAQTDFRRSAEAIMISKSPASVVVNEAMDIVHIHGIITPFLEAPQGKPTHNLIKMAREGLSFELRNAIHKAAKEQSTVNKENIPVKINSEQSLVNIEIVPLTDIIEPHYLIRFENKIIPAEQEAIKSSSGKTKTAEAQKRSEQLEKELSHTREDMRSITEDMEAYNEELQSANEELQSSNEEMQSLNEELETSKEELQSTNEELVIVNQEMLDKQEQLNTSRFYSEAIITTMREPLVVLDKTLRVKTANAAFYKKFNVEEIETENKLFYEIQNHQFDDTLLRTLLEKILPQKNLIEDFEINLRLPDKGERTILINARQIVNEKKAEQLILLALEDITDRVNAEKILRINEARTEKERKLLHDFFKQAPAMLAILKGPEHIYEFANPAFMEFISNHNPIGKTALEALPEIAGQGFIELLDNVYKTGETFTRKEMPVMLNKGNGNHQQFYANLTYQAFANDKDKTEGILVFAYDVTEQVNARKQIEASEKRFSNILSQSLMSIAIYKGPEMILAYANEPMLTGLGKGNAVLNKPLLEGVPELKDQVFPKLLADVYASGVAYEGFETKAILVRNGIPVDVYFNFVYQPYRDVDDTITGVTVLATDVTLQVMAKKQTEESEAKFRTLSETIPNMIWTAAFDGEKNYINQYFLDYTGLTFEELTGDGMKKIVFPDDLKEDLKLWNHSLQTGEDFNMEKRIRYHDGTYRWHICHASAQKDMLGNITGWIGSNTEIEVQKKFTEALEAKVIERTAELQILNEELNQTNGHLEQFAYVASHDLQEPLRKIITFSARLQDMHKDELSTEVKSYLNKIESSSARMSALIHDLLNFSQLLQFETLFVPTDLNETLKSIINDFELLIQDKKAEIIIHELPTIDAIPLQMNQLFNNLISNALKFCKEGVPPVITISSRLLSQKEIQKYPSLNKNVPTNEIELQSYFEIIFKDNGIGFEQQYAKQIFTIFQRLHSKEDFVGTGIGLALAKKIVENHHGELFTNAKENKGAEFHVILPVKQSV
ncbi:MAG: CheR family methyltransferase [Saprospiraceae bacterium]